MRALKITLAISSIAFTAIACAGMQASAADMKEDYFQTPMPPGFQVIVSEIEGPVFADAQGHTLYTWPKATLRNGNAGEDIGKPTCGDAVMRESSGTMSPYPGGYEMPEVDKRLSCAQAFPPVYAAADAKPVGKWTILKRLDGKMQWAYQGRPLYTSVRDKLPGEAMAATGLPDPGDQRSADRRIAAPASKVPAQFAVHTTMTGRIVTVANGKSIYTSDRDGKNKSSCKDACLDEWTPVLAAASAVTVGEWTTFERAPGVLQWSFRGRPVYLHQTDPKEGARDGSDVPGWHNVYTQMMPEPPKGVFALKNTIVGEVLGDSKGMTVYRYSCVDDALDQQACDMPDSPQAYRFAVCGGGSWEQCLKTFPYVIAQAGAKTNSAWGTMYIDPKTGKEATANAPAALHVWTFRRRPVYTFVGVRGYGDHKPSDINANAWGEGEGARNGYHAFVMRDVIDERDGNIGGRQGP